MTFEKARAEIRLADRGTRATRPSARKSDVRGRGQAVIRMALDKAREGDMTASSERPLRGDGACYFPVFKCAPKVDCTPVVRHGYE